MEISDFTLLISQNCVNINYLGGNLYKYILGLGKGGLRKTIPTKLTGQVSFFQDLANNKERNYGKERS